MASCIGSLGRISSRVREIPRRQGARGDRRFEPDPAHSARPAAPVARTTALVCRAGAAV